MMVNPAVVSILRIICRRAPSRPFATIGRRTVWLGGAGQGSRLKLVVNACMSTLIEDVSAARLALEDQDAASLRKVTRSV